MAIQSSRHGPAGRADSPVSGILFTLASLLLLTFADATTKWLGRDYPLGQILGMRAVFIMIPAGFVVSRTGGLASLRIHRLRDQGLRAVLMVATSFLIAASVIVLPLAEALVLLYAGPLFATALAAPVLGERVGRRRWGAVILGFAGILIMLRPGTEALRIAAAIPLAAALMSALRDIVTKRISASETTNATMVFSTLATVVAGAATIPLGWRTMDARSLGLLALSGTFVGFAHMLMIESVRRVDISVLSPFRFSGIVWGVLLGYLIWGDLPDAYVVSGAVLVIASGIYVLRRETARRDRG